MQELLRLKWEHPGARVVVGNTEVGPSFFFIPPTPGTTFLSASQPQLDPPRPSALPGIEVKFKNMVYPVILAPACVPELNAVTHTDHGERRR